MSRSRQQRVRSRMAELGVDALLLAAGADLRWLTGYAALPFERLTMLVLPIDDHPTLVVPRLEVPKVEARPELFTLRPWDEAADPVAIVARLVAGCGRLAISDRAWCSFLLALQAELPDAQWRRASDITAALRAAKGAEEVEALSEAAAQADRVAGQLVSGQIPLLGRTEAEVATEIESRLRAQGHDRAWAMVCSGPNSASPHHEPGSRRIQAGEPVLCDFGGAHAGYCSDLSRTVFTGVPPAEFTELYAVLQEAQAKAVAAATIGATCESVDGVARRIIDGRGYGSYFVHRTGHGIGLETHEDPYIVEGNTEPLVEGHAFSVEPGIYLPGRWGARIEDIVVVTLTGPKSLNRVHRDLAVVDR